MRLVGRGNFQRRLQMGGGGGARSAAYPALSNTKSNFYILVLPFFHSFTPVMLKYFFCIIVVTSRNSEINPCVPPGGLMQPRSASK